MSFESDFDRAKIFYPQLRDIIRKQISIDEASQEMDLKQATDMVVMQTPQRNVACRVRNEGYADFDDVTMRFSRPSGVDTEFHKIRDGHGDWSIYAHAKGTDLAKWVLYDLHEWRGLLQWYSINQLMRLNLVQVMANWDNSSKFLALCIVDLEKLWPSLIISQKGYLG